MKNISLWQDISGKKYNKLEGNTTTDILIIGGGITGISTFYHLKNDKRKVILVDKNRVGFGATSRSSAKVTFLQENIYSKLESTFNEYVAHLYYKSQKEAIDRLVKVIDKEDIDCNLEEVESFIYTMNDYEIEKIKREKELLNDFKNDVTEVTALPNGANIKYGIKVPNTYVIHPLKLICGLAEVSVSDKHQIYENTCVIDIKKENDKYRCITESGDIFCNTVILAMHYPYFLFPYMFPTKCYLEKSFLIASNNTNKHFSAINISKPYFSIRYTNKYKLTIGASNTLGFKQDYEKNIDNLKKYVNGEISYIWSNHDIMTLDNLPYIGYIKNNLILATGYNTWGMTNGFLAGFIIKDLLNKKENKYQKLFNPKRELNLDKIINYPINIFNNIYSFMNSKINKNKGWYNDNPYFTKIDGKSVAIYKDDKNIKHIVINKCPHLGCGLIFNKIESTWDCPCHGSRFDLDGNNIIGPSNYDIKYRK